MPCKRVFLNLLQHCTEQINGVFLSIQYKRLGRDRLTGSITSHMGEKRCFWYKSSNFSWYAMTISGICDYSIGVIPNLGCLKEHPESVHVIHVLPKCLMKTGQLTAQGCPGCQKLAFNQRVINSLGYKGNK